MFCSRLAAALSVVMCGAVGAAPLSLDEASRLAQLDQPQLTAQAAAVDAARERSVSAGQLPDPVLVGALSDLSLTGADRYSLHEETDTQFVIGLRQAFPGGNKRELRGKRERREADRLSAALDDGGRELAREAGMAWLDVWKAVCAQSLASRLRDEAQHQLQSAEIAYRAGGGDQAGLLALRVEQDLAIDQLAGFEQDEWHARNQLRRWLPRDAERPIAEDLPVFAEPDLAAVLQGLEQHPHLATQDRAVALADTELELAGAEKRADWSAQLAYGYRPEFADYASLSFELGLPAFTRNRQDRDIAARRAELDRASQLRDDALREHRAEVQMNVEDWRRLHRRLERYDNQILPQAQARLDAALASYGAGRGALAPVLDARRALLDLQLQKLGLELDAARHQVQLRYFDHALASATRLP
ncbi:MAG: TolC family protein [Panacagrimonas sp.]